MALYSYQAFAKDGKKVNGTLDAGSLSAAKDQLAQRGLFPTKIELAKDQLSGSRWSFSFGQSVSIKQKILFTKQLAVLLKSGVQLLQALELLVEQFQGNLRSMLIKIKDDIKEGVSFADALSK